MIGLLARVVTVDGRILVEQSCRISDDGTIDVATIEAQADYSAGIANEAVDAGQTILLQFCDPEGDLLPAGEWVTLHELRP